METQTNQLPILTDSPLSSENKNNLFLSLKENLTMMDSFFYNCDDIKKRTMKLGKNAEIEACIYYVEVTVNNLTITESVIGKLISRLMDKTPDEIYDYLDKNALGITDVKELPTFEEAVLGVMIGDGVLFIDGYDKAIKIKSKGYPLMGVSSSQREKVMRGSNEGFMDSLKGNTALMRKRIRNNHFKVKEMLLGTTTHTTVAICYMEGIVRKSVLKEIWQRLSSLNIEGLTDTGIIEQLTEEHPHSPFPQYQTTERPDNAALAVLTGRITLFVDNSPVALLLPTNYNSFFKTPDDYYNRYAIVSFARIIRYLAAFLALTLPALYLAIMNYHPDILPTNMLLSFASGRLQVPFPTIVEVLLMEGAFELLREAGVRIPGPMGNTIGIVGGLIIGQAAVSAGIVSPVIVVVVALTALSSFAIPNDELSSAFRILKYFLIFLSFLFGFFGIIIGLILIACHLASLKSFGFPYVMPMAADDINDNLDKKDFFFRMPLKYILGNEKNIFSKNTRQRNLNK